MIDYERQKDTRCILIHIYVILEETISLCESKI